MGRRFRKGRFSYWLERPYLYKRSGNGGVIGNSRALPHRYVYEGDNGPAHRREVKRKEERLWRKEADEEM